MPFTFRIVFTGLCAFVPDKPFDEGPTQVQVLLPNVLKARSVHPPEPVEPKESDSLILPPHLPMLTFNMKHLRPSDGQPTFFVKDRLDLDERLGMVLLLNEDLAVQAEAPDPGALQINNEPVDPSKPLTAAQRKSMFWLTKVDEKLVGTDRRVRSELLGPLSSDEKKIISRILLTTGLLSTNKLSEAGWQYLEIDEPIAKGNGRRIATQLALELKSEKPVVLSMRGFGAPQGGKIVFAPPKDSNDDVEINIQNLEPDIFLGVPQGQQAPHIDPDFSVYYDLLEGLQEGDRQPILRRFKGKTGKVEGSAGDGKPCSPAGMGG